MNENNLVTLTCKPLRLSFTTCTLFRPQVQHKIAISLQHFKANLVTYLQGQFSRKNNV